MEKESVAVGMKPWEAMHKRFAMDNLDGFIEAVKAKIPYCTVACYAQYQRSVPVARSGVLHVLFFNPFLPPAFPAGLYWPDVAVQLAETLTSASFSKTLNVHPVGVDGGVIDGVKRTGGVMGYGADGAYINDVYLITLCMVAFFSTMG